MEGLEEYQDCGDDFWNYDSSEIYNNLPEAEIDYNSDLRLGTRGKKLKERTETYSVPFKLEEINSFREKLFNKFISEDYKIYKPLYTLENFAFGKHKDKYVEEVFENQTDYIKWLISDTGAVFYLKDNYTFAIKCGLDVPILLLNEMKLEYYEALNKKKRKIFDDGKVLKVTDDYYDLYL